MGGHTKAPHELAGDRIVQRQLQVLRRVAEPVFIVGGSAGEFDDYGLQVVEDVLPGHGALGGIYTAIVASPAPRTFVVACDMPFVSVALLEHLAAVEADIVIPRSSRGLEPLCALYARTCAGPIRRRLERGLLEARLLPEGVSVVEIAPETLTAIDPDGLLFVNLNTPHDYERARELLAAKTRRDRIMDAPEPGG